MRRWQPGLPSPGYESGIVETPSARAAWRPSWRMAALVGAGFGLCLMVLDGASEFIYFQF
jgi:hypothetical protein